MEAGSIATNIVDLLLTMRRTGADPQKLTTATISVQEQLDTKVSTNQLEPSILEMSALIGDAMLWITEREENGRKDVDVGETRRARLRPKTVLADVKTESQSGDGRIKASGRKRRAIVKVELMDESDNAVPVQEPVSNGDDNGRIIAPGVILNEEVMRDASENEAVQVRRFKCDRCEESFVYRNRWMRHKKTHLDDNDPEQAKQKRPFECDECGQTFQVASYLKHHMKIHQDDEHLKKPHECEVCGKRFTLRPALLMHKKSHLPDDDPERLKYSCNICKKFVPGSHKLSIHKRTHISFFDTAQQKIRAPFECEECGKPFTQAGNLHKHMSTHARGPGARKPHECDVCGKRYAQKEYLKEHKLVHLRDGDSRKVQRVCQVCGKHFSSKAYLQHHQQAHLAADHPQKEKNECAVCGKKLAIKSSLEKHARSHINAKIKCDKCEWTFTSKKRLAMHQEKMHSETLCTANAMNTKNGVGHVEEHGQVDSEE